jgi:hypothetical protein
MVVGFNHNFTYKGVVYHIQTEDSGRNSPTIVTLLYHGGTILASRKTSYADIARVDNLEQVVEELMKEQHKGMLRGLKNGEFDDAIDRHGRGGPAPPPVVVAPLPPTEPLVRPSVAPVPPRPVAPPAAAAPPRPAPAPVGAPPLAAPVPPPKPTTVETSLDEIILSYLIGKDK